MQAAGHTPAEIAQALAGRGQREIEVWPENVVAWEAWCGLSTQWRMVAGFEAARYVGLDYAAVWPTLRGLGVKKRRRAAVFNALREMELAALPVLNAG